MLSLKMLSCNSFYFYIKPQQIGGNGTLFLGCNSFYFYIKPQHFDIMAVKGVSCNSFYFYIKPQPGVCASCHPSVVIHSISTSNHN